MAELNQREFAARLRAEMKATKTTSVALGRKIGKSKDTVADYRKPDYKHGPPNYDIRRAMEQAMGLPRGRLDEPLTSVSAVGRVATEHGMVVKDRSRTAYTVTPEVTPEEEQFRAMLRNVHRTGRAHRDSPELFDAQERWKLELAFVRGSMFSRQQTGDPMPDWLTAIYNELLANEPR